MNKTRQLMLGNEAVARGAFEAGVRVATAYPGTPSTEITENIAKYDAIYSEWAPNEKVAMEVAVGASLGGARTIVSMKHVGVQCGGGPAVHIRLYGGERGPGSGRGRRSGDAQLPERAGQPVLRPFPPISPCWSRATARRPRTWWASPWI